jgi:hypothetical protein
MSKGAMKGTAEGAPNKGPNPKTCDQKHEKLGNVLGITDVQK